MFSEIPSESWNTQMMHHGIWNLLRIMQHPDDASWCLKSLLNHETPRWCIMVSEISSESWNTQMMHHVVWGNLFRICNPMRCTLSEISFRNNETPKMHGLWMTSWLVISQKPSLCRRRRRRRCRWQRDHQLHLIASHDMDDNHKIAHYNQPNWVGFKCKDVASNQQFCTVAVSPVTNKRDWEIASSNHNVS